MNDNNDFDLHLSGIDCPKGLSKELTKEQHEINKTNNDNDIDYEVVNKRNELNMVQQNKNINHLDVTSNISELTTPINELNTVRRSNRTKKKNLKYFSNSYIVEFLDEDDKLVSSAPKQQIFNTNDNTNTTGSSDEVTPTIDITKLRRSDRIKYKNINHCTNLDNNKGLHDTILAPQLPIKQDKINSTSNIISGKSNLTIPVKDLSSLPVHDIPTVQPSEDHLNILKDIEHKDNNKHSKSAINQHELTTQYKIDSNNWSILTKDRIDYRLKVRESLFILHHKPSLNKTVCSVPLIIFPEGLQTNKPKVKFKSAQRTLSGVG